MTYRYLGANKYEIKLTVYRDCSDNVDFDNPAFVSIYNKANNNLVYNKGLTLFSRSIVPANPPNPCFVPPAGICVEIGTYKDTVQLAPNNSGYTIAYQRCCHNASVLNLVLPQMNGMTVTTDIPPQINNSSQFTNFPPIYICLSDTFNYSFASTDADGDNLVYQFCTPLNGGGVGNFSPNPASPPPYIPSLWSNTFTASNPISNSGGITLNSTTGQLKFKPSLLGQYAIGICVLEYRNNVLINTNRLELQFNIVNCYLTSSIPTASNLCQGLKIPFQNGSTNANAFHWNFGDLSTLADTSNIFTPTYTYPTYGTYTVSLIVCNTAYGFCKDSVKKVINVHPLLSPTLQPTYSSCFNYNNFNFNVGGSFDPSANFNWNFTPSSNSPNTNINNTTAHFTTPTPKTVSVVVNQFGCKDTLFATVTFTNPIASINENYINCFGLTPLLGYTGPYPSLLSWDFGDTNSITDTSTQISPNYTYPAFGNYTIILIVSQGVCSDTLKYTANIKPNFILIPDKYVQKQCLKNNSFNYNATGIFNGGTAFSWTLTNQPNPIFSSQQNPSNINFTNAGIHTITVTATENGCVRTGTRSAVVFENPKANVILSDSVGCEPLTIKLKQEPPPTHPVQALWTVNSNTFTTDSLIYTFNNAGLYSYSIVVKDTNNCTDTITKTNYIQVNPTPKVKPFVNPLQTSILFSQVTFIDSTLINHNTYFSFGDEATSTKTLNVHTYQSAGQYNYQHIVYNQFGCADTTSGIIIIDDIANNYIPNIFTPNGDNANDIFKIKGESITKSSMNIFNRWGSQVFENTDALKGWNGINQNNNIMCDDGTYFYIIKITLNGSKEYTFKGNVSLFK